MMTAPRLRTPDPQSRFNLSQRHRTRCWSICAPSSRPQNPLIREPICSIPVRLWDAEREKFIPHMYLVGSPFPKDFDENANYCYGGTAVAIEADLLTPDGVVHSLEQMVANVRAAGAASIGSTVHPAYPEGFFKNPQMRSPHCYQAAAATCVWIHTGSWTPSGTAR